MYVQVAVDVPLYSALTYTIPEHLEGELKLGQLIQVPFRNKAKTGLVVGFSDTLDDPSLAGKLRDVHDVVDPTPLLTETGIEFLEFIAEYYLAPIGEVMRLAIPAAVRVEGMKLYSATGEVADPSLSEELREALAGIGGGAKPVRKMKEETGLTYHNLRRLEELDLVEVSYAEQRKVRAKTEKYYRLLDSEPDGRTGKRQKQILELLEGHEEDGVALAEIREVVDSPYSSLSGLEDRGIIEVWEEEIYRDPFRHSHVEEPKDHVLTAEQQEAIAALRQAREADEFRGFVLHGVTGSGKTHVYVHVIQETLAAGKRALVLLPEIALTPQFVSVFRGYFGDTIAVLHSGLSTAEKFDQWRRIRRDEVDIVIGARSAIFAPVNDLGVIVVDEEHDTSFKQEEGPRYNARDMALVRGKLEGAQVILGSATPSLESYQNSHDGRLHYLSMPERVEGRPLPDVEILDLRTHSPDEGPAPVISDRLREEIEKTLEAGQQTILFLNRRGYSPCVICESCGHIWRCPNCDVSLTYHRRQESLRCHHCDHAIRLPEICPVCGNHGIGPRGIGTEKLDEYLTGLFPEYTVARLDRDTSRGRGLHRLIRRFARGEIDLLVGTQMVTKGHDFPEVTTVGVVLADLGLNFPDFRGAERTFQLLTQVAGRAGRGDAAGMVYVQTYEPEHYSLTRSREHDFEGFAEIELSRRRERVFPPFGHLIALKFEAAREAAVRRAAHDYAFAARRRMRSDTSFDDVVMLGPALAPFERLRGKTRWQILFKSRDRGSLRRLVIAALSDMQYFDVAKRRHRKVRIVVDVDPINLL